MTTTTKYKSPLNEMVMTTPTDLWNDSCSIEELTYSIGHGAVGATTNPTIVLNVLKKEMDAWRARIFEIIAENSTWTEDQLTWELIEEMAVKGAALLYPAYERYQGKKGRLSIQTNPTFYRNAQLIVEQAVHFNSLAPNMQVKIPVSEAGLGAIEEATYRGVSINATVSFTVPQAIAVAEAIERGLNRRTAEGLDIKRMAPVCTIMEGRVDDWLHILEKREGIIVTPGYADWAGVACVKKAYQIYQKRGYRARLLAAAYRHHLHWSELIGGDLILSIPCSWQKLYNASDVEVKSRIADPIPAPIFDSLYKHFADFRRAYDEDGMTPAEFDTFGPNVRTLRQFIESYRELTALVREFMLPNPDVKR
jgi:transaldolase